MFVLGYAWDDRSPLTLSLCGKGWYSSEGQGFCRPCPSGQYSDEYASSSCKVCPPGYVPDEFSTGCMQCSSGTYADIGDATCHPCPSGSVSGYGSVSCELCTGGLYSNGYSQCYGCSSYGQFSMTGFPTCLSCPAGSYNSIYASEQCQECPVGHFNEGSGDQSCYPCDFSRLSNAANCVDGKNKWLRSTVLLLPRSVQEFPGLIPPSFFLRKLFTDFLLFRLLLWTESLAANCQIGEYLNLDNSCTRVPAG